MENQLVIYAMLLKKIIQGQYLFILVQTMFLMVIFQIQFLRNKNQTQFQSMEKVSCLEKKYYSIPLSQALLLGLVGFIQNLGIIL